jgi:hypothetical protein
MPGERGGIVDVEILLTGSSFSLTTFWREDCDIIGKGTTLTKKAG